MSNTVVFHLLRPHLSVRQEISTISPRINQTNDILVYKSLHFLINSAFIHMLYNYSKQSPKNRSGLSGGNLDRDAVKLFRHVYLAAQTTISLPFTASTVEHFIF